MSLKLPKFIGWVICVTLGGCVIWGGNAEAVTWYGPGFYGSPTSSGEVYTGKDMTAAHPSLPFGTEVTVPNGDKFVTVRINDRCACDLDVSEHAAEELGIKESGNVPLDYSVSAASTTTASSTSSSPPAISELPKTGGINLWWIVRWSTNLWWFAELWE